MTLLATLLGLSVGLGILVALILAAILIFEIWMVVDVIQNDGITSDRKILWVVGMFLLHPIVAIAYFFTDRRKKL